MELDIQLFADGKVVIDTELNTRNFENGLDKMKGTTQRAGSTIKSIVAGLGITKLISSAMSTITGSIDGAISRYDTLNQFPKVMQNLGISSEDAEKSIQKMSKELTGLPTTLDAGARAVQRFTTKNGDVEKSTEIFLALNNAILAGGAPMEQQASALEQMSQAYARGKPDMYEWRNWMTTMPAQLKQVATAMGYVDADELGEELRKGGASMDDFMDAIIRLNEEGVDGLANFKEQAKTGTEGIATSITNAKTQVVKGVADIINGIDRGLKKSGTSISKIISDIGKKVKETLDKVAKLISKINFKKLFNTLKALLPVVSALVVGFIAYSGALKAIKIAQAVSSFAKLTKTFITLLPAIKGANAGMLALNSTVAISPIGLLIASVAGLTAGLYLLQKASEKNVTSTQKINNEIREYKKSMQEADKVRQDYLDKNMNEIEGTEALYNELQALVDENGKVKEGYEDRVKFIVGQLNDALGTEIKLNDGIIEGYQEIRNSIAQIIEQKRAKVLLDAQEEKYNKAKDEAVKLEQNYANAQGEYNKKLKERTDILKEIQKEYGLTNKQLKEVSKNYSYINKDGKKVNLQLTDLGKKLALTNGEITNHKNTLNNAQQAYIDNQKIIGNYEEALKQLADGNYQAVLKMYEDTTNYQGKTNEETSKKYESAIQSQKTYLQYLKEHRKEYNEDVYNKEVKAVEDRIKLLEDEQNKANAIVETGQTTVKTTWNKKLAEQLSEITGHNVQFVKTANGNIQAYIDGHKQGAPMTKKQAKKMADDMANEMKKAKSGSKKAGVDFTLGTTLGIQQGQGGTFNAVKNYGSNILQTLKRALKEHSPSKASEEDALYFTEGFDKGLEKGKKETIKNVKQYGEDIIDGLEFNDLDKSLNDIFSNMQRTIDLEQAKLQANVETGRVFNTLQNSTPVAIDIDADVEMDGQKVGRLVTPVISRTIKNGGGV